LQALREKLLYERESSQSKNDRALRLRYIRDQGAKAMHTLAASEYMPVSRKNIFLWHIRDALRIEQETKND
jgi:hypothetical protein